MDTSPWVDELTILSVLMDAGLAGAVWFYSS